MPATAPRLTLEARSWAINAQWRTVKHRYGVRGKALIRVARMPPEECMEQLLAFLSSEEGCQSLYLDGKPLTDEWLPLSAWYERTTATNRTETVEVYHALRHVSDATADGPYVVHDGCTYKESHTFYFGVANLPELPADASGVQHRIESLRRDEESGLYSCVLTKRERLTIDLPEYTTHQDALQTQTETTKMGIKGDQTVVDAAIDAILGIVRDEEGKVADGIIGGQGFVVKVQKRKNEDCTTDVTAEVVEPHKAHYEVTLAIDPNGTQRSICTFRNFTKGEADAVLQAAHSGSAAPNEFGLYDGQATTILHEAGNRRARASRDYRPYHEERTGKDIRIVNANGKMYRVTETYTYICGVLHDNDPSATSKTSAYAMVDGCASPRVQYLGDGYWSYYGVRTKTITWASVNDSETITHTL